jgi:hypothetical protein
MALGILSGELEKLRADTSTIVEEQDVSESEFTLRLQKCFSSLVRIKTLVRKVYLRVSKEQLITRRSKSTSEKTVFKLQNLLYEKHLLLKEIENCENMETPEWDKITLVDDATFREEAPKRLSKQTKNSHLLFLAKLEYEQLVRQELAKVFQAEQKNVSAAEQAMQ